MKHAIESQQLGKPTDARVKVVSVAEDVDASKGVIKSIPAITSFHNFKFTQDGIRVWKQYKVGQGDTKSDVKKRLLETELYWIKQLQTPYPLGLNDQIYRQGKLFSWHKLAAASPTQYLVVKADWKAAVDDIDEPVSTRSCLKDIFTCPHENCSRMFTTHAALLEHEQIGICDFRMEKQHLIDKAKSLYAEKVSNNMTQFSLKSTTEKGTSHAKEGWALKVRKASKQFTGKQRFFLVQKFEKGETTGRKVDPMAVAKEMQKATAPDGSKLFQQEDYLTPKQISSFYPDRSKEKGSLICWIHYLQSQRKEKPTFKNIFYLLLHNTSIIYTSKPK